MVSSSKHSVVQPFERIEPRSSLVRLFSPKFIDIWAGGLAGLLFAVALTLVALWVGISSDVGKILLGGVLGVIGGTAAKCYDLANKRAGTVDMIASDIISIGRVLSAAGVLDYFINMATAFEQNTDTSPGSNNLTAGHISPHGFADVARRSDYFSVFHSLIQELRVLDPPSIRNVTAFFTFLKAARDATEVVSRWGDTSYKVERKVADVVDIVYLTTLCVIHGRQAIESLVEDKRVREYSDRMFIKIESKGLEFLKRHLRVMHGENDERYLIVLARLRPS